MPPSKPLTHLCAPLTRTSKLLHLKVSNNIQVIVAYQSRIIFSALTEICNSKGEKDMSTGIPFSECKEDSVALSDNVTMERANSPS